MPFAGNLAVHFEQAQAGEPMACAAPQSLPHPRLSLRIALAHVGRGESADHGGIALHASTEFKYTSMARAGTRARCRPWTRSDGAATADEGHRDHGIQC